MLEFQVMLLLYWVLSDIEIAEKSMWAILLFLYYHLKVYGVLWGLEISILLIWFTHTQNFIIRK